MNATLVESGENAPVRKIKVENSGGAIYGMGVLGAMVYFVQHAESFMEGALGIAEAILWPAVLVYKAMELLNL